MFVVHGSWSTWNAWTPCSETCGNGNRNRNRTCDNPLPQFGGDDCVGDLIENEVCYLGGCPGKSAINIT